MNIANLQKPRLFRRGFSFYKASVNILKRLALALYCSIENLLEDDISHSRE